MTPNPVLDTLGLPPDGRALLIHTDDIGMCHASLSAYADLSQRGLISAGSVMVPCPWFLATAQHCLTHPDTTDMGVHVTLTSEWDSGYRWGPVSTRDPASGLMDTDGFMPRTTAEVRANAKPEAVAVEIEAQVTRALEAGIDVTHMDSHMGGIFDPRFGRAYVEIALEHSIPPYLIRRASTVVGHTDVGDNVAEVDKMLRSLEARGLPMFDHHTGIRFSDGVSPMAAAKAAFAALQPGLTYLITHPSIDTPELRAIITGGWQTRVTEYELLMQPELRDFVEEQGIHIITWRILRDLMRASL